MKSPSPSVLFPLISILFCFSTFSAAQNWSGIISSSRATSAWSNAGATIVNRTTICNTLGTSGQASTYSQSVTNSQINSALSSCSSGGGGVVLLNPGTYALAGQITINAGENNVTLRGSGPDQTKIVPTASAGCGNTTSLICVGTDGNWSDGPDHSTTWRGTTEGGAGVYPQGATHLTLSSVSGLSVGQVLILDQADPSSDTGNIYLCGVEAATCSSEGQDGGGGRGGNHSQLQFALVTAISGTTVTIASPGLYMPNWSSTHGPGAWWATTLAQGVGIEALSIDNRAAGAGSITVFNNAYNCWMKNVASIGGGTRSHVDLQYSANITVRDSYFWGAAGAALSYGIEPWMGGNELAENNIFQHVTTPLLAGAEEGSVFDYNYAIDMYTTSPGWLYESIAEHDPGTVMDLFEGNVLPMAMQDAIHGSHAMETYFRNRLSGLDTANSQTQQTVPYLLQSFSRYANVIGNVLGTSGYHNTYQDNYSGTGGTCDKSIYNLGWGSTECSNGGVNGDSLVISTLMRWGNYDVVNAAVRWNSSEVPSGLSIYANPVPSNETLPSSFFLSSAPSWWPSTKPFPPIGPDVTGGNLSGVNGHAYSIPAEDCYVNVMGGSATSEVGVITTFNANNCYGDPAPPPAAPSGLIAVIQ